MDPIATAPGTDTVFGTRSSRSRPTICGLLTLNFFRNRGRVHVVIRSPAVDVNFEVFMIVHVAPTHKMLKRLLFSLAFLLLTNASISFAQQARQPAADQAEVNELINRAAIRMNEYKNGFKDLTAEEEQKVEEYDDK